MRVFTGAVMPEGPDCVIMHEDCQISDVGIICGKQLKSGTNMRPAGENIAAGETLAAKGSFLGRQILASWPLQASARYPYSSL